MGTRSLTIIHEEYGEPPLDEVVLYRQFDGYIGGHGHDLAEFLAPGKVVNGLGLNDGTKVFNGMSCLAAQLVAHFKTEPGGFYLHPSGTRDAGEEYRYHVRLGGDAELTVEVERGYGSDWDTIFTGTPEDLATFEEPG